MGVRTCLRDLQFVAVRFSFNSWSLQGVSSENSLLPRLRADVNPKVTGSNPVRPIPGVAAKRELYG
jgi:hypothetical protein